MGVAIVVGALLTFVAVVAAALGLRSMFVSEDDAVRARVTRLTHAGSGSGASATSDGDDQAGTSAIWAMLLRPFSSIARPKQEEEQSATRSKLVTAGFRGEHAVEIFFGSKVALAALLSGGLLALSAVRPAPISKANMIAVVLAAIGFYAPNVWLRSRVESRQALIMRALPDCLDLLVTCVEAGLGLDAALGRITDEMELSAPELAGELRLTTMEIQAGVSRADAFRRLAQRTALDEMRSLSAMIIQTETFGTSIARALRLHSDSMRTRRSHRAEEAAAKVAVKMMIPLILCILPSLFTVILGPAIVRIARLLLPTMGGGQ